MELTADQIMACQMYLTRKQTGMTMADIAREAGVSVRTLQRWKNTEEWKEYQRQKAIEIAEESLGDVLDVLARRALEGRNAKFMELYLKVGGILGDQAAVKVDLNTADPRSNEAIEQDIEELKRQLAEFEN